MSYYNKKSNGIGKFLFIVISIACIAYTGYDLINIGKDYVSNLEYKPMADTVLVDSSKTNLTLVQDSTGWNETVRFSELSYNIDSANTSLSLKLDSINRKITSNGI